MNSGPKNENKKRPKLSLVSSDACDANDAGDAASKSELAFESPANTSRSFTNLEKFQEMVQDIVSFEIKASIKTSNDHAQSDPAPINLTRARIAGLESIKFDNPGQVIRLINTESNDQTNLDDQSNKAAPVEAIQAPPRAPKNGKKK